MHCHGLYEKAFKAVPGPCPMARNLADGNVEEKVEVQYCGNPVEVGGKQDVGANQK